jgi:hypothetical protein
MPVTFLFATLTLRGALQAQRKLRCATAKKSNQKCRKLAKFDLEITYSLWDSLIQYTLAVPTRIIFIRPN